MERRQMAKEYKITKVSEIAEVITVENLDRFLEDFRAWCEFRIAIKLATEETPMVAEIMSMDDTTFHWVDDGKVGLSELEVKLVEKL